MTKHVIIKTTRTRIRLFVARAIRSFILKHEPPHEKTNILHMRKQRRRSDQLRSNCEADQRLCFRNTLIVQFLYCLNLHLLCLNSSVCVGPVRKPHCWFSHDAAYLYYVIPILVFRKVRHRLYGLEFSQALSACSDVFALKNPSCPFIKTI